MALKAGSADNVTAVVADCLKGPALRAPALIAGAVEESLDSITETTREKVEIAPALVKEDSPLKRASDLLREGEGEEEEPNGAKSEEAAENEALDIKEPPADTAEIPIVSGKNLNPADPVDAEVLKQYGREVAREARYTAGEPVSLRLTPDRRTIAADGYDLSYVTVEALDANGVLVEKSDNSENVKFALLFEIDGDERAIRHVLYNCAASRPSIESKTKEESIEPGTETLNLTADPRADGLVKSRTGDTTSAETYAGWYESVYVPVEETPAAQEEPVV